MQLHYVWVLFPNILSVDNTKKTGLYGYGYDFSVDYVDDILDNHKYFMVKTNVKQCSG